MNNRLVIVANNKYLSQADFSADDDVFIISEADGFVSKNSDLPIVLKNILELCEYLECKSYVHVEVYGGILNFKSEINVRIAFSGFMGVATGSFKYFDSESKFINRVDSLTRVFNSLGVDPSFEKLSGMYAFNFETDDKGWRRFKVQNVVDVISQNMLNIDGFIRVLKNAYVKGEPLSYFRVNHCENRLVGQGFSYGISEAEITYQRQFGYNLNSEQTNLLSSKMLEAFRNADVLGVPTIKPMSTNKLHLLENSTFLHLAEFNCFREKEYTSVNLHYDLGVSEDFKSFLKSVDKLYTISGRNIEVLEKCLDRKLEHLGIPAQFIFDDEKNTLRHYPDRYNEIVEFIEARINSKDVVLIGAGILGKLYCDKVKACGGIAIDLGSLFDAMAGVQSRSGGFNRDFWWNHNDSA